MASSDCSVDGQDLFLHPQIDHRDGAGALNAFRAVDLADMNNHHGSGGGPYTSRGFAYGPMDLHASSWPGGVYVKTYHVRTTATGGLSIVLTWDATPTCSGASCTSHGPDADLDLILTDAVTGSLAAFSLSNRNNYEAISRKFVLMPNRDYKLSIHQNGSPHTNLTYFGLAWMEAPANCVGP